MRSLEIRNYNSLTDFEKLGLVDFSYSRLDTYNQCPSKYFYTYITKEERSFSPAAVLGNIVHSVLENTIEPDGLASIEDINKEYVKNISIWDPQSKISSELISVGTNILNEFYDQNSDAQFNVYEKEMSFSFIIGSYAINGYIDRVDVLGDRVNIVDYKTGKWEVAQKDIANNLQLGIYALAMSNIFPEKEIYAELYYLRSGRKKGHLFSREDIENVKIRLIDNINKVISDNNFTPTNNPRPCSYCDHAASGVCGTGVFRNNKSRNR